MGDFMGKKIIAWDLGTGGNKASLYDEKGICLASNFTSYNTFYPAHGWHEQRPVSYTHLRAHETDS